MQPLRRIQGVMYKTHCSAIILNLFVILKTIFKIVIVTFVKRMKRKMTRK